jgi:protein-S-isoprenylcysteine O-methyltransferase Ste14
VKIVSQNSDIPHSDSHNSVNQESDTIEEKKVRVLSIREDWAVIPYLALILIGFIVSIIDFVYVQKSVFQSVWVITGVPILLFGGAMRFLPRRSLIKAGFGSIWNTPFLQIVEDHRLVTDGYYKHIRHPIYLGEIGRSFGLAITLSSLYGLVFMTIGLLFLLIRIDIEEKMLTEAFGEEYREYQRNTKKLIPCIY